MQNNTIKKITLAIMALSGVTLSACNGGSNSNAGGQNLTGTPIQANASQSLFSTSSCLSGKVNYSASATNNQYWYANGEIDIVNNCSTAQTLNGQTISLSAQDSVGNPLNLGTLDNWWVNNGHYQLKFVAGNGNNQIGTISAQDGSGNTLAATINGNQTIAFTGGVNLNGNNFDLPTAQSTFTINGSTPPVVESGTLSVAIDTSAAGCAGANVCNGLTVNVNNANGTSVATISVPSASYGATYTQAVAGLTAGQSYTVAASAISNTSVTYTPAATQKIVANTTTPISVKYTQNAPAVITGNATISLPNKVATYTGNLQVQILNTKESNALVNSYVVKQGNSFTTGDLPISDATHVYKIKLVGGIADPLKGQYFIESGLPTLTIKKNATTTATIPMVAAGIAKPAVTLAISGLVAGDNANVTFSDASNKYNYVQPSNQVNGSVKYSVESGLSFGISVAANGANYKVNPINNTQVISKAITIKAAFESQPVTPSTGGVAGWPSYVAMGAVGGPNIDPVNNVYSGGDDSFGGKPVDAVFKYAGVNGNGDPGVIDPPMNALRMTTDLTNVSAVNDRASKVVIVEYTGEMSGGENFADFTNTSVPNPNKQNSTYIMARHFVSLAADAQALADRPVIKDGKKYYGSLIMNPDLLGAMEQNGYINSVNAQLPANAVNTAVDQALCVLTNVRSYTNTATPNGDGNYIYKGKTYNGTPYQILTAMLDDGYPAWSISGISDAYWGTGIDNKISDSAYSQVGQWFNACVSNPQYDTTKYARPNFPAGFDGWVQANNWLIRAFAAKSTGVTFGWQDNMWAVNSGFWLHNTLTDSQIAAQYSTPVSNWLKTNAPSAIANVGSNLAPDFFVFDRYEMDDSAAPGSATLYSARSWDNFLSAVGQVSKAFNNIPVMLWQIPGSHLPYVGEANPELFNGISGSYIFSTAPVYFFGDSNLKADLSNLIMGSSSATTNAAVGSYLMTSNYNCPISGCNYAQYLRYYQGLENNYDWSRDNGKLALASSNNVFAILWGGGNTTNVIKNFSNPDDHGWLASKIKTYYQNPQPLRLAN